jgi:formamidopyrimidine-DNA glycosylase
VPELPEVETIAADVRPHLQGATIRRARLLRTDVLRGIRRPALERGLTGRRCTSVGRRAKHLVFELDDGARLVIQPRMTGAMLVDHDTDDPYDVLRLDLDTGLTARFRDVRRLGVIYLLRGAAWQRYDAAIGPEPLDPGFTAARLATALRGSRAAIKKAIMDQKRLAGVGNIYASEACWIARVDPSRPAHRLGPEDVARLRDAIVEVLGRAVTNRGTTVRDYRTGTGEPGEFQELLAVYGRAGEPCRRCGTRIAMTHALDARATYFCHRCQP